MKDIPNHLREIDYKITSSAFLICFPTFNDKCLNTYIYIYIFFFSCVLDSTNKIDTNEKLELNLDIELQRIVLSISAGRREIMEPLKQFHAE